MTIPDFLASDTLRLLLKSEAPLSVQALKLASLDSFIKGLTQGQVIKGKVVDTLGQGKALIEFNGKQAVAELGRAYRRGESLTARVEQISPSPLLKLVSPAIGKEDARPAREQSASVNDRGSGDRVRIRASSEPGTSVSQKELDALGLSRNQTTRGQVIKSLNPETVLVRLSGQNVAVALPHTKPIQSGAPVEVRVLSDTKGISLAGNLLKEPVVPPDFVKSLFAARQPLSGFLGDLEKNVEAFFKLSSVADPKGFEPRLKETLQLLSAKPIKQLTEAWVKSALDKSGFSYEAKVSAFAADPKNPALRQAVGQDLKGQLLELSRFLETQSTVGNPKGGDPVVQSLLRQVNASIQHIEMHQLSHLIAKQENQPLALQLPQFLGQEAQNLKVFFRREEERSGNSGEKKPGQYALAFFLDLSGLGPMRVDAKVQGHRLGLALAMESEEALQFIATRFEDFQSYLKTLGFDAEISCRVNKADVRSVPDDLAPGFLQDVERLVDLRT